MTRTDFDALLDISIRIINGIASARGSNPIKLVHYERQEDIEGHDEVRIIIAGLEDEVDESKMH